MLNNIEKTKIITINRIPNIRSITNNIFIANLKLLTERQLVNRYGMILATVTAQRRNILEYKLGEGYIVYNVESYYRPLYETELKRRNLFEKYIYFIELGF